ncbi:MAG: electron transfer flavoprotein subunit beta/FixA family protein [Anaerolineae bacterium]
MNIVVCMKVVPKAEQVRLDPETRTLDRSGAENEINEPDKNALEMALQLKEQYGGTVTVLSMGPPFFDEYLRLAVAMGADDAVLLSDRALAGADTLATSYALAKGVQKVADVDLVLCGEESSDGATGQVPPGIAEWLDWSQITYVAELSLLDDGRLRGRRTIHGGHEVVAVPLPAVASVELGVNSPRFPDFRRKRWADREFELTVWDAADIGADPALIGIEGSRSVVSDLIEKERPERMRHRIDGTVEEKAQQLFEIIEPYLQ